MDIDVRQIRQISARTGLGLKFLSKDVYLSNLLKHLEGVLDEKFVLKGGTAIARAGYLAMPRFSEDVDLDVLGGTEDIPKEFHTRLDECPGFSFKKPRHQPHCLRYDGYYENHFGERDRIKVEVSVVPGKGGQSPTLLQSPFTFGLASVIPTYSRTSLFVKKIDALAGRKEGKDVYDLWGMHLQGVLTEEVLAELLGYTGESGKGGGQMLKASLSNLDAIAGDVGKVANATNHYIPRTQRPDWNSVIEQVRSILEGFVRLI